MAWYWHCQACSEMVAGQMDLVVDQPDGAFIRIYRCRTCGTPGLAARAGGPAAMCASMSEAAGR
jgi:hypothetical protein